MELDRSLSPPVQDFTNEKGPTPEVIPLPSGARVHILKDTVQAVVRVEFVFKAGKWYQPKAGVASLTAKMLKEGTSKHSAKQIADTIDYYGASMDVSHGFDRTTLTIYCLSKFLRSLLPLGFEILQNPTFQEKELSLMKNRVVQTLAVDKQKNAYVASEAFTSSIYGKEHPYSTYIDEAQINSITKEDLINFHQSAFNFSTAEIFITGDLDEENKSLLLSFLASASQTFQKQDIKEPEHLLNGVEEKIQRIPSTNEMQAALRIGKISLDPSQKDYPALYVLNHALGGYFGSRLMKNIREEKGFTYGIYSSISTKEHSSLLTIGTEIKGDKIENTFKEIEREFQLLKDTLISDEELVTVKKHIAGKFISDIATIFDKMDKYKSNVLLGLSPNFFYDLQDKVKAISPSDLQEIALKLLKTDSFYSISVGGTK
ncbi:MAG: M16 family metallopeptidase [Rufibacter sp.]